MLAQEKLSETSDAALALIGSQFVDQSTGLGETGLSFSSGSTKPTLTYSQAAARVVKTFPAIAEAKARSAKPKPKPGDRDKDHDKDRGRG